MSLEKLIPHVEIALGGETFRVRQFSALDLGRFESWLRIRRLGEFQEAANRAGVGKNGEIVDAMRAFQSAPMSFAETLLAIPNEIGAMTWIIGEAIAGSGGPAREYLHLCTDLKEVSEAARKIVPAFEKTFGKPDPIQGATATPPPGPESSPSA